MTPIPDALRAHFNPMPPDFAPSIMEMPKAWAWRGRVEIASPGRVDKVECEYGLPKSMGHTAAELRAFVWEIMELGRLGRGDLLTFARVDRHSKRPAPLPVSIPAA